MPGLKNQYGCKKEAKRALYGDLTGYGELKRCPRAIVTDNTFDVMRIYNRCRMMTENGYQPNSHLPSKGGVMDQSATLMDAFDILDSIILDIQTRKREAQRKNRG